jgi:hypothetical protein
MNRLTVAFGSVVRNPKSSSAGCEDEMSVSILPDLLEGLEKCLHRDMERPLIEINIAGLFLTLVLGGDWASKYILPGNDPDPWLLNASIEWMNKHPIENDVRRVVHQNRIVRLANAFVTVLMYRVKNAELLRQRIQSRPDKKATFMETEIASLLAYNGCDVEIIKESGQRGEDFDLLATVHGVAVSVEVTAITGGELSTQTILNKLHSKRDQVPNHRPAVLYLHVPAGWMIDERAADHAFTAATNNFMSRSKRIGMMVLVYEYVLPLANGGIPRMAIRPCYHNFPRHKVPAPGLFVLKPDADGRVQLAVSLLDRLEAYRDKVKAQKELD